MFVN